MRVSLIESQLKTFWRWDLSPCPKFPSHNRLWRRTQAMLIHPLGSLCPSLCGTMRLRLTWERPLGITRSVLGQQRDGEGIAIAVTPVKIEMIPSRIAQPISIQFSVIRNQREGERERMRTRTHVPTKNQRGSKRPKLVDINLLICQQELHSRRKTRVSLSFGSPACYL